MAGLNALDLFIAGHFSPLVGKNIDDVGRQIEDIIDASPYCWRWLEPQTEVFEREVLPYRINIHVTRKHKILRITVG